MSVKRIGQDPKLLSLTGYSLTGAAEAFGVSTRTLRRALADGRVEAIPVPQLSKLISVREVERVLAVGLRRGWGGPRRRKRDREGASP
jgi:hypothetical protein